MDVQETSLLLKHDFILILDNGTLISYISLPQPLLVPR